MLKSLLLLFSAMLPWLSAGAKGIDGEQDSIPSKEHGKVAVSIYRIGSMTYDDPISVKLVAGKDTMVPDHINNSVFFFSRVPVGKVTVYAKSPGFIEVIKEATVKKDSVTRIYEEIGQKVINLKGVVVKGHAPAMVMRGDTIRFNPQAVTIYENDNVRQILEQMPGVEVSDNNVSIHGKNVERTYVNGNKTFGTNPMNAVDHVSATDVVNINAYEEDRENQRKGDKRNRRMVMDIRTKEPIFNSTDLNVLAGAGGNTEKNHSTHHDVRHFEGGNFNFFSDQWLAEVSLMNNNLARKSTIPALFLSHKQNSLPNYGVVSLAGVDVERNLDSKSGKDKTGLNKGFLKGGYDFTHNTTEVYANQRQRYYPSSSFSERTLESTNNSMVQDNRHAAFVKFDLTTPKAGRIAIDYNFSNQHKRNFNQSEMTNTTDGKAIKSSLTNHDYGTVNENRLTAIWSILKGNWTLSADWGASISKSDNSSERENIINGTRENTVIKSHTKDYGTSAGANIAYNFTPLSSISLGYDINWNWTKNRQDGTDMVTLLNDTVNTWSYKSHQTVQTPKLSIWLNHLIFDVGWQNTKVNDKDIKWNRYDFSKSYNALVGSAALTYDFITEKIQQCELQYTLESNVPTYSQLRPLLNNSNPYFLTSGNPGLKASTAHKLQFRLQYHFDEYGQMMDGQVSFGAVQNAIVNKSIYFANSTFLPQWHYTAAESSTLNTYGNVNGVWNVSTDISYDKPFIKIKSLLHLSCDYRHSRTPYYYNNERNASALDHFSATLGFNTSAVKKLRLNTRLAYSYDNNSSSEKAFSTWNSALSGHLDASYRPLWKYFFANASYDYRLRRYGKAIPTTHEHIVNLYLGANIFRRKAELSLSVFDLLHSRKNQKTLYRDNYVSYQTQEDYGSYFTVNFTWMFRKVKSNRLEISHGKNWD